MAPSDLPALLANLVTRERLVQLVLLAQPVPVVVPVTEVNKARLVLLASRELPDKTENLVEKETKALLANEVKPAPQGQLDHPEAPVHPVLQVHKEEKESVGHLVLQVRLAFPVVVAYLDPLVTMVTQGNLAMQAPPAKTGLLVHLVLQVPSGPLVLPVQKVSPASQVKKVHQVQEAKWVLQVVQDFQAHLDNAVLLDCPAGEGYQALLV